MAVPPMSGSAGRPSRAVSTTVPDSGVPAELADVDEQLGRRLSWGSDGEALATMRDPTAARNDDRPTAGAAQASRRRETSRGIVITDQPASLAPVTTLRAPERPSQRHLSADRAGWGA